MENFQSDFKQIARFFKERRLGKDTFKQNEAILKHAEEFLEFLFVFTKDPLYKDSISKIHEAEEKGEQIKMCWVAQSHVEEGREKEAILTARMMFRNGLDLDLVSACVQRLPIEKLQEIYIQEMKRLGSKNDGQNLIDTSEQVS